MHTFKRSHSHAWLQSRGYRLAWLLAPQLMALLVFGSSFWISETNELRVFPVSRDYEAAELAEIVTAISNGDHSVIQELESSANRGDPKALDFLGRLYDPDTSIRSGLSPDRERALSYFSKAAELGSLAAMENTARLYRASSTQKSCQYSISAIDAGSSNPETEFFAAACFFYGDGQTPVDHHKGFKLFERSSIKGNPEALYNLGMVYQYGYGGTSPSFSRAIDYYQKSMAIANGNNGGAHNEMGLLSFYGAPGVPKDFKKAYQYFIKGYEFGNIQCAVSLSAMHSDSKYGVGVDQSKAFAYALFAAERGDSVAHYNVFVHYFHGKGVPRNFDKALSHYLMSISLGSQRTLDVFLENGSKYDVDFLINAQEKLTSVGLYTGHRNGKFNEQTKNALKSLLGKKYQF